MGTQVWAATNLDVVTFRNGDPIPEVKSNEEWEKAGKEGKPAWCYYENDAAKGKTYGRMYNWHAVNDARGLAPKGWHVPSNEEWIALENHVGVPVAGLRLKCDKGWMANGNGENFNNFCIPAGGYRDRNGRFHGASEFIYISGTTEEKDQKTNKLFIWGRGIQFENKDMMRCGLDKEFGLYVRCIKDSL
ncbi:fibrobacter succinogenes major paralogous domain-containing protein [Niastella caeni]|nr:fibrobacter succinogenes major paralogous domain-containing protein [Niastella caeni]